MNITGNDDLFVVGNQLVIHIEKDFLRGALLQTLNIVDQQIVYRTNHLLNIFNRLVFHRLNQQRDEILTVNVQNLFIRLICLNIISDGMQQMGFSQSGISEYKQRVVEFTGIIAYG